MKTVLLVFGTRPEAIKMAPLVHALKASGKLRPVICVTGQHRTLLRQALEFFELVPDFNLQLMQEKQDLTDLTSRCLIALRDVLAEVRPHLVLVHGDTSTAFASSLAALYARVPIGHVEAGMRSHQKYAPFPEEMNRRMITPLADYHFAPTSRALANLRAENVPDDRIFVTGNTCVDALLWAAARNQDYPELRQLFEGKKMVLMTAHRRENWGEPLEGILAAVKGFAVAHPEYQIVVPVHPNPIVKDAFDATLGELSNVSLLPPQGYGEMTFLLKECHFVMTDSGGIQEEAPTFGKPVLVLREATERPEALAAGCTRLVGHDETDVRHHMESLAAPHSAAYHSMARARHPFGEGHAADAIVKILESLLFPAPELQSIQQG